MALSIGGGKNKSKQTDKIDQTQVSTLSDRAAGMITDQVGNLRGQQYGRFDPASVDQFLNPRKQQVIDATLRQADYADQVAANRQKDAFAKAGAFGDNRRGIYEAELQGQQSRDRASLIAGLESDAYDKAQGTAVGENQNANAYNLNVQQLISQLISQFGNEGTTRTTGTNTSKKSGSAVNAGFTYGGG